MAEQPQNQDRRVERGIFSLLGPGLVTGASDDDPSGIATYSQVGAQYGYKLLWPILFSYPLMAGIQEIAACIGRVTGHGIAGNLRKLYSGWIAAPLLGALVIANVINLAADIGAMGAAVRLLIGGPSIIYAAILAIASVALQVFVPYTKYVAWLKWLTLALFAYVGTVLVVKVSWGDALRGTFIPYFGWGKGGVTSLVAILGTTISPYLFFWQASEEVEEEEDAPDEKPLIDAPDQAPYQLSRIRIDTYFGMAISNLVAYFIILAVAATLHAKGVTQVDAAEQAAQALRPVAGDFGFLLFALGMIGTGLLAVPVLAGSAAYAVGEMFKWPVGLELKFRQARGFYGVLVAAVLLGLILNLAHVNPIRALFWSAVVNGVAAGPIMVVMMLMSCNSKVMGDFCLSTRQRVLGWVATAVMLASAVAMFAFWGS